MKELKEASIRKNVRMGNDEAKREAEEEIGIRYDVSKTVSKKELEQWKKKLKQEEELQGTVNLIDIETNVEAPPDLPKDE
jgi:hypothetical protein